MKCCGCCVNLPKMYTGDIVSITTLDGHFMGIAELLEREDENSDHPGNHIVWSVAFISDRSPSSRTNAYGQVCCTLVSRPFKNLLYQALSMTRKTLLEILNNHPNWEQWEGFFPSFDTNEYRFRFVGNNYDYIVIGQKLCYGQVKGYVLTKSTFERFAELAFDDFKDLIIVALTKAGESVQ